MAQAKDSMTEVSTPVRKLFRGRRARLGLSALTLAIVVGGVAWWQRESIADRFIEDQLSGLGIPARYEIVAIGPQLQILRHVVVGDPGNPDLLIERVELRLRYRIGLPQIDSIKLVRPRLRATLGSQGLSFGALDRVIYAPSEVPFVLPDINLELVEASGSIASEYGPLLLSASGSGGLDDGFRGTLKAGGQGWRYGNCTAGAANLEGVIAVNDGTPKLDGPFTLARITCNDADFTIDALAAHLALAADSDFARFTGKATVRSGAAVQGNIRSTGLRGTLALEASGKAASARFDMDAIAPHGPQFSAARLGARGEVTLRGGNERYEASGTLDGANLRSGPAIDSALRQAEAGMAGTLAQDLLAQLRSGLAAESDGSTLEARFLLRGKDGGASVVVPNAAWRGGSGEDLVAASQFQFALADGGIRQLSGNLRTGGRRLPRISGRIAQTSAALPVLKLEMEPYQAGDARLAVPELEIVQTGAGAFGLKGRVLASGKIPGGRIENADIPLEGGIRATGEAWLWRRCADLRFALLTVGALELRQESARLCPAGKAPVLAADGRGATIAGRLGAHAWTGTFAGEPASIALESAQFSSRDGGLDARGIRFSYGTEGAQSRFAFGRISGAPGRVDAGSFEEAEVSLGPVPLDITRGQGSWSFTDGKLALAGSEFWLKDREVIARFKPLVAHGARLELADGRITAEAVLRHPASDAMVAEVAIGHDLASSTGHAALFVPALQFGKEMQPVDLSDLALGIIALADGTMTGSGRIDWNGTEVASTGSISTDRLDFAAEFGPVKGLAGTVRFTDLVSLTTAPNQTLTISSINPGIEIFSGELTFDLRDGQILNLRNGRWPFLGGTLTMRPLEINFGAPEERRYVIEIIGANAAQFVQQMDLGNISVSGIFDGTFPIVFDANGNGRIEGGQLISRAPGGNLSYVGDLTYEDLSAMGNYAFQMLRSLDYSKMVVVMNGPLAGEIITQLKFDGVRQGKGASRNFITREIAKLPIEFRVNVRAQFYQLMTSFKSIYDPGFLRDPRDLGLLTSDGERFIRPTGDAGTTPDEPAIQRQESEQMQ